MPTLFQINTVINSGSTGRIAEEIGQLVMKDKWQSYIAFGRNDRPSQSNKIKIGNDWDILYHGLITRIFDRHGFASNSATSQLIKEIKTIKPDIIHLHNIHGYYLNVEILFNYLASVKTPVVWTLHDCWPITGHCTHFEFANCDKWKTHCKSCPQKNEYPASLVFDNSKSNFRLKKDLFTSVKNLTIVSPSNWLTNIISQSFLRKFHIHTIQNGIDINAFTPYTIDNTQLKYGIKNKFVLLGVASTWNERKGLQDFITLSKSLQQDEVIILVGVNKNLMTRLPQNIIPVMRTESVMELAELYSVADVFINPTWEDNFPTTNLEAMACGTPVITFKTGGSPESLTNETGFIVEQGDINGIRESINKIKLNGRKFCLTKCRNHVMNNFDKDKKFREYFTLYNKLIQN